MSDLVKAVDKLLSVGVLNPTGSPAVAEAVADCVAALERAKAAADWIEAQDRRGYDPHGPEVTVLHYWFAHNYQPYKWIDDGCRSENARDLLNHLAENGFIVVPAPPVSEKDTTP